MLSSLVFAIACGDDSGTSANDEDPSSSSSSSWSEAIGSSNSKSSSSAKIASSSSTPRNDVKSSSSSVTLSPYSARHDSNGTPKKLFKIGVAFDAEKRTLGEWKIVEG